MTVQAQPAVSYRSLVGQVVAQQRTKLGLGQLDLAEALSITQASFSRLESGQTAMTLDQLSKIATRCGTTPGEILGIADRFADRLRAEGYHVVAGAPSDIPKENSQLVGAALIAVLLLLMGRS